MSSLILIRHGDARSRSETGRDADRLLSDKGKLDIVNQAEFLRGGNHGIETIYHSPYLRAQETATLLAQTLNVPLEVNACLIPSGSLSGWTQLILGLTQPTLFVSHLPIIADFSYQLTGRHIRFSPGTAIKLNRLDAYSETCQLEWVQHP